MERKPFKSRLFKKNIKADDLDYWFYLYSETLYRLKLNSELNCPCSECWVEKTRYNHILDQIEEEGLIPSIKRKSKMTGRGDCGRRLGPVA
ncbi:MAG: hypothetical protein D8M26_00720 [Ignavibacteriae bacterium]|nr:hypothetical protein [Ignavibacteriota bacterium]